MRISYDGSRYFGFQLQRGKPDQPSIQQVCMAVAAPRSKKLESLHHTSLLGVSHIGDVKPSVILHCFFTVLQTEPSSSTVCAVMPLLVVSQQTPRCHRYKSATANLITIAVVHVGEGVKWSKVLDSGVERAAHGQKLGAGVGEGAVQCFKGRPQQCDAPRGQ